MEVVVREGQEVRAVASVEEAIVVVFVRSEAGGKLVMINPDIGAALFDRNTIISNRSSSPILLLTKCG